jgi:hypothetical protein
MFNNGDTFEGILEKVLECKSRDEALEVLVEYFPRAMYIKAFSSYLDIPWCGSKVENYESIIDATWQAQKNREVIAGEV